MENLNFHQLDLTQYPPLVSRSLLGIQKRFLRNANGVIHNPSASQWLALADVVSTLDSLVLGKTDRKVLVTSLDPGVGKTSSLISYLDVLLEQTTGPHADCGVLVAMNTLDEIERFIRDVGIPKEDLAVWTSRDDLNAFGRPNCEEARVLITSHERVGLELKEGDLWSATRLSYRGATRRLRVWDEAYLPGYPISINVDDVLSIMKALRSVSSKLRDRVKEVFDSLEKLSDGSVAHLPDYLGEHGVTKDDLIEVALAHDPKDEVSRRLSDSQSEILTGVALVSGKRVKIRIDGRYGHASVDYHETMPQDLAPILVMDASSRPGVRVAYDDMVSSRKLVKRLHQAPKSYRNLTVHVWSRGGGKASWKDRGTSAVLLEGIANTIKTKPQEEWLIVHHKPGRGVPDVPKELQRILPDAVFKRLSFTNWGRHKATNRFSHISNVILAGTLFLRPSQYEARKRLSAALTAETDVSQTDLDVFQLGEQADDILQALCRASVRLSDGDSCPKSNAYIIASARSGIEGALPAIFPDCVVETWRPVRISLKGKVDMAAKYLERWASKAKRGDTIKFSEIAKYIGEKNRGFKDIRHNNPKFKAFVAELGLYEYGSNVYFTSYRKA